MKTSNVCVFLLTLIVNTASYAVESSDNFQISERIKLVNKNMIVTEVIDSPVEGIKQVEIDGREYIYTTSNGEYIFYGELFHVSDDLITNITEVNLSIKRSRILSSIKKNEFITFLATSDAIADIFVFTDITCSFCRKFHSHIKELNEAGITVHYLAYPREGVSSSTGEIMQNIWCSPYPNKSLTDAKSKGIFPEISFPCNSSLSEHYTIASSLGVSGTPAIYSKAGKQLGGYLNPDELVKALQVRYP